MRKIKISITIDPELNQKLEWLMQKLDRSKSWIVSTAVRKVVEKEVKCK
jgi:predicted transcriptional regulator